MKITNNNITIYEALMNIKDGKYVMPAFQRQYVWSMFQIEKLWDSILLDYPIATFLYWHIDSSNTSGDTYFCNFLNSAQFDNRKSSDSLNFDLITVDTRLTDIAVLDGQQRLTSLYVSLLGEVRIRQKHSRKKAPTLYHADLFIELDKNKIETDEEEFNSKSYDIKFTEKISRFSPTQFKLRDIMQQKFRDYETREIALADAIKNVSANSRDYAKNIIQKLYNKIFIEPLVHFTQIDEMKQDDALEMFVRFNSGGKPLRKSEITMSILEAYWPSAKTQFGLLLKNDYEGFGTDFIIRAALMLFGDVIKSNISKNVVDCLKNNWNDFKLSLANLKNLISSFNIDFYRFQSSWNVLLPILYCVYHNPDYLNNTEAIKTYLMRAIIFNLFQSGTTQRLAMMKSSINEYNKEITIEMLDQISELRVTDARIEDILDKEIGSRVASEVLYYLSLEWIDKRVKYEVDHLHPAARFDGNKPPQICNQLWLRLTSMRNKLPNLHLLEGRENASKSDMRLVDYLNDMTIDQQKDFLKRALVPNEISLEFEQFEKFYNERQQLLADRIKRLLS